MKRKKWAEGRVRARQGTWKSKVCPQPRVSRETKLEGSTWSDGW